MRFFYYNFSMLNKIFTPRNPCLQQRFKGRVHCFSMQVVMTSVF